jgi:hypothetical protein
LLSSASFFNYISSTNFLLHFGRFFTNSYDHSDFFGKNVDYVQKRDLPEFQTTRSVGLA